MLSTWVLVAIVFVILISAVYFFKRWSLWLKLDTKSATIHAKKTEISSHYAPASPQTIKQLESVLYNLTHSQRYLFGEGNNRQKFLRAFRTELAELENLKNKLLSNDGQTEWQGLISDDVNSEDTKSAKIEERNSASLLQALSELTPMMEKLAEERQCKLSWLGQPDIDVSMPPKFFVKMLRKLIVNALAHNPSNNEIYVQFSSDNAFLYVSVIDFGDGIAQETVQKIFDKSVNRYPKGRRQTDILSHIDLSLIQSVLKQLGGDLSFHSALQFGTRVNVSIPLAERNQCERSPKEVASSEANLHSDILYLGGESEFESKLIKCIQQKYRMQKLPSSEQLVSLTLDKVPKVIISSGYAQSCELLGLMKTIDYLHNVSNISVLCITEPLSNEQRCHLFENEIRQLLELPVTMSAIELVVENMLRDQKREEFRVAEAIADYTLAQVEEELQDDFVDVFEQKFLQCIEDNYAEPAFSQEDCANQLFMSTRNLQRKISSHLGSTFRDSLKRYRVEKAKELIMQGETVTNAGLMVGFSTPSYFAKCFKAEFGFVPSMLSRRVGQG
ncbi:MAG: helix-turn-helix domain-containing protein [Pseudomonadota bacterium]